ncbi:hypothetical protein C8J56DRAFT_1170904 [Mycena floridula]|nr:hypothetical protein C8J56DRAFT_1170904 [Mycena floridula]
MVLNLADLCDDILFLISGFCCLDVVTLAKVNIRFFRLSTNCTFWIAALNESPNHTPLPCLIHDDLATLDITALRAMAICAYNRNRNLGLEILQVTGPFRTIPSPNQFSILFIVPGTHLTVLHFQKAGMMDLNGESIPSSLIECWNTQNGNKTVLFISRQPFEGHISPFFNCRPNLCTFAVFGGRQISVISFDYVSGMQPQMMRTVLSHRIPEQYDKLVRAPASLNADVIVYACRSKSAPSTIYLVLVHLETKHYITIGRADRQEDQIVLQIQDNSIYMFTAEYIGPTTLSTWSLDALWLDNLRRSRKCLNARHSDPKLLKAKDLDAQNLNSPELTAKPKPKANPSAKRKREPDPAPASGIDGDDQRPKHTRRSSDKVIENKKVAEEKRLEAEEKKRKRKTSGSQSGRKYGHTLHLLYNHTPFMHNKYVYAWTGSLALNYQLNLSTELEMHPRTFIILIVAAQFVRTTFSFSPSGICTEIVCARNHSRQAIPDSGILLPGPNAPLVI